MQAEACSRTYMHVIENRQINDWIIQTTFLHRLVFDEASTFGACQYAKRCVFRIASCLVVEILATSTFSRLFEEVVERCDQASCIVIFTRRSWIEIDQFEIVVKSNEHCSLQLNLKTSQGSRDGDCSRVLVISMDSVGFSIGFEPRENFSRAV